MDDKYSKSKLVENDEQLFFSEFPAPLYEAWKEEAERLLKGVPFNRKMFTKTPEGITLQSIYRREDLASLANATSLPGFAPFNRGNKTDSNQQAGWEITENITIPDCENANQAITASLEHGLTSVSLTLDDTLCSGVKVSNLADLRIVLKNVNLAKTPVHIHSGISAVPALGLLVALARENDAQFADLTGGVVLDPLGELLKAGSLPKTMDWLFKCLAENTGWAIENAPKLGTGWADGQIYAGGGASAVEELAFVIATAVEYLRKMEEFGIEADQSAPHLRFSFAQGSNFFMEVAKLRAARMVWNNVLDSIGVPEAKRSMWIHAETASYTKTTFDPYVNMLRGTTEAFSAIAGGADSVSVASFDEAIRPSDSFSRRIARNTQLVLKNESHLSKVIDAGGGSWYIESLTAQIAEKAWKLFQQVENLGGMTEALTLRFPQDIVENTAMARAEAFATRKSVQIGVNKYANATEVKLTAPLADPVLSEDTTKVPKAKDFGVLHKLEAVMKAEDGQIAEAVIDAAAIGASINEINRSLNFYEGKSVSFKTIPARRLAEPFEKLRDAVEAHREGGKTKVFIATLGAARKYMARLDFVVSFFEVGGFEVIRTTGFDSPEAAATEALAQDAKAVVICGLDDAYTDGAPAVARMIKEKNPNAAVLLAGLPSDPAIAEKLMNAGVDTFIHIKSNVLEVLGDLARKMGVTL